MLEVQAVHWLLVVPGDFTRDHFHPPKSPPGKGRLETLAELNSDPGTARANQVNCTATQAATDAGICEPQLKNAHTGTDFHYFTVPEEKET